MYGSWSRAPTVLWRRSGEHTVILGAGHEGPLLLDGCGPQIWQLLAVPHESEQLLEALGEMYGEAPEALRPEITTFLDQLASIGACMFTPQRDPACG